MNCQDPGCAVYLSWFRGHIMHRPGYYLESGWYCSEACLEKGIARRLETRSLIPEDAAISPFQMKLEDILVENGVITRQEMDKALAETSVKSRESLAHHLTSLGLVKEHDVTLAVSRMVNLPVINLNSRSYNPNVLNMIPLEIVRDRGFFPLAFDRAERRLVLVTYDPSDLSMMINLRGILDCQVTIYLGDESSVREMIELYCQQSERLRADGKVESPGAVRGRRDLARWIVGRAKTMEARTLKIDRFDRFIWTRFVLGQRALDCVLKATDIN